MTDPQRHPPRLFAFDMNSHFARIFTTRAKDGNIPTGAWAYHQGSPVFCLKPLLSLVEKEINIVCEMGLPNTHIVMVFDHAGKNFRHRLYDAYKGTRPPKPDAWKIQESLMFDMFSSLGYPCLRIEDVESDDVLSTLAHVLPQRGVECVFFTGDKDVMSCASDRVNLFSGRDKKLLGVHQITEKFGIPPCRILDFLALKGDIVDNIPGVTGIGDGAARAILQNMTLNEAISNPERIASLSFRNAAGAARKIAAQIDNAKLSRALVDLKTDVALGMNLNQMKCGQPDYDRFLGGYMRPRLD